MALKQATIFKNFLIDNDNEKGVFFGMDSALAVKSKNDNFADSVMIYVDDNTIDIFSYKYITFDNLSVFEITDIIQCEDYYTLFVDYLSRIHLNAWDKNFAITHVMPRTLDNLGFTMSKWIEILGGFAYFSECESAITSPTNIRMGWGIKIDLSAMPQNLGAFNFQNNAPTTAKYAVDFHGLGNLIYNASKPNNTSIRFSELIPAQRNYTIIVPFPIGLNSKFKMSSGIQIDDVYATIEKDLTFENFIKTLDALITDLTLSVEIVPLSSEAFSIGTAVFDFANNSGSFFNNVQIELNNDYSIIYNFENVNIGITNRAIESWLDGGLACVYDSTDTAIDYPFMFCEFGLGRNRGQQVNGFIRAYDFIPFSCYNDNYKSEAITAISVLGNIIEINSRLGFTYIQVMEHKLRIYFDYNQQNYIDIENSIEFNKSAFSNFEAYTKANLQLVQLQQNEALKQQQAQAEKTQLFKDIQTGIGGVSKAVSSGAFLGPAGAIASLASTATDIAFDRIQFNQKQQNERANLKLQQSQALGALRSTIVPGSSLAGAIQLSDVIKFYAASQPYTRRPYSLGFFSIILRDSEKETLYRYLIDNQYLEQWGYSMIPDYFPAGRPALHKFTASPDTNYKSFLALCKPKNE